MNSILGLDIGHKSIKAVQLEPAPDGKFKLQAIGKIAAPVKGIESESESDKKAMKIAVKTLVTEANIKTKNVVASLPDAKIFTRLVNFPPLTDEELASSIRWEADQYIPIPLDKIDLHWQVVSKQSPIQSGEMEVLLIAVPKNLVKRYIETVADADLEPNAFETESMALNRSLVSPTQDKTTTLVISLGQMSTDLSIVRQHQVILTRSISSGEDALNRAVVDSLGFDPGQAEAYKNAYGILPDKLDGKLSRALIPVVEVILSEIKRATLFYQEQRPSDPIKRAILTGGPANMPGLVVYLAQQLGYEVIVGDPWSRVEIDQSIAEGVSKEAAEYSVAVGLAMRRLT